MHEVIFRTYWACRLTSCICSCAVGAMADSLFVEVWVVIHTVTVQFWCLKYAFSYILTFFKFIIRFWVRWEEKMTLKIITLIHRGKCCEIKLDYCICSGQCCKDFRLLVYLRLHLSKREWLDFLSHEIMPKIVCTTTTGSQYKGIFAENYIKVQDHAAVSYIQLIISCTGGLPSLAGD